MINSILIRIKTADSARFLSSLADLGGTVDIPYPGAKDSEYLVLLSIERLLDLEAAIPGIQIIQIYET